MRNIFEAPDHLVIEDSAKAPEVSDVIRKRRSIYADEFTGEAIADELLEEILINATWAPTHKMTEPWRFIVFKGRYLEEYGRYMADYYEKYYQSKLTPVRCMQKLDYLRAYPLKAACMIGVILVRNPKLPEWEEVAAVASAVQNMALTCTAHHIGAYWSTPRCAIDFVMETGLAPNEQSLGLVFMGCCNHSDHELKKKKKRAPIADKVTWLA